MISLNRKYFVIGFLLTLLSTIGIAMSMMPLPPGSELEELMQDISKLNKKLEETPDLLNNTRLHDTDLSGLVVKNTTLSQLNWRNVKLTDALLENITIEKAKWVGVKCKGCTLRNVTFSKVTLDQDKDTNRGSTSFENVLLDGVRFIDTILWDVEISHFKPSSFSFERVKLKNGIYQDYHNVKGSIDTGVAVIRIKDSEFHNPEIFNLQHPSEIIIENTHIEEGSLGSSLKRLEIRNSYFEGSGPASADYVYIADSKIHIGLPEAHFIHLKNNEYLKDPVDQTIYSRIKNANTVFIASCNKESDFYFGKSNITNLYIDDCAFEDPYLENARIGYLQLCNVSITRSQKGTHNWDREYLDQDAWDNVSVREARFHNVQFTGPFPVKGLTIGHLQSENSQLPAELTRAAKQHSPLSGGCPPLPDIDALKQKALSTDPPPPLSSLLQERFSDPDNPPFRDYGILSVGGMLFYREAWISHFHAMNGGLGAYPEPPAIASAVLRLQDPGEALPMDEMILEPGEWRTGITHEGEPCRALLLHAPEPSEPFHLPYHLGICPNPQLSLELRFVPAAPPAHFDVEQPWTLSLQSAEPIERVWGGGLADETREALLAKKDLLTHVVWS